MNAPFPKEQRAVRLFLAGHSCIYVSDVLDVPYGRVIRLRNSLDLPQYDKAADPSVSRLRRWSGLQLKPVKRARRSMTVRKMTPNFYVKRCQFPLWPHDGVPDGSFCGDYTKAGSSYCAHHHAICYVAGSAFSLARRRKQNDAFPIVAFKE